MFNKPKSYRLIICLIISIITNIVLIFSYINLSKKVNDLKTKTDYVECIVNDLNQF